MGGEFKNMIPCDLCGRSFQMGPHLYDGEWIPQYQMSFCRSCFEGNWDGIGPVYEGRLEAHLKAHEIPLPKRNGKGWYPRGK